MTWEIVKTGDHMIKKYRNGKIYKDEDQDTFYWEDAFGVIRGEGFDTIDECKHDIDQENYYTEKSIYLNGGR